MLMAFAACAGGILSASVFALAISNIRLWIELKAMQKSTHQIVMPSQMADSFVSVTEDDKKNVEQAFSSYTGIN